MELEKGGGGDERSSWQHVVPETETTSRVMFAESAAPGPAPALLASAPAPAPTHAPAPADGATESKPAGRGRARRLTKEAMISKENLLSGTDESGVRIRIFTASLTCDHTNRAGLAQFEWTGDTVPSDAEGLRIPGQERHGHGEIKYVSGNHYVGQWVHDKREGAGTFNYACGDTYVGSWKAGMYEGHGKYSSTEGDEYEGEWKMDRPHGHGRYLYRDSGNAYEGQWERGMRDGKGKEVLANGDVYEGVWEAGERVSLLLTHLLKGTDELGERIPIFTAKLTCAHQSKAELEKFTYDGESEPTDTPNMRLPGRMRHGHGEIKYDSGNHYVGGWVHDKREGVGKYTYACGDVFDGSWKAGMYDGQGKYSSPSGEGDEYEGEWQADLPHGHGRYLYRASGDVFEGEWREGKRHGKGTYTAASGEVRAGEWADGELVAAEAS